jgi:hypothetical protein
MAQPKLTEKERAAVRAEAAATDWKSNKKASAPAPQQSERDTITPRGNHPSEAVYVARDKKSGAEVSFDVWGRKLDSLGHVVAGDRQRAGDAGAKEIYRPPTPPPPASPTPAAAKSPSQWTTGPSGPMSTVPQRSTWDNSVLPGTSAPAAPSARSVPPGVLAPGGVDPATGQKFPTAFNGMLPSTPQAAPQATQMGPQAAPQGWRPSWDIRPLENFMSGNSPYSPVAPKVNIPGFGQLPASAAQIPMQTEGLGGFSFPEPVTHPVYESYQNAFVPVTNPLDIYSQGVNPTMPPEPTGPQNFGRSLDVADYMPGGRYYKR